MSKEVILTGLRSNSEFHLGNYLGAILPMVELQKKHAGQYQLNMFIPDLHSFTTPIDHDNLYQQTLQNLKVFVAAGLDINNPDTFIYRQSYIKAHSELTIILNCFTYFGELRRMTQFKDKASNAKANLLERLKRPGIENMPGEVELKMTEKELVALVDIVSESEEPMATAGLFDYPVLMAADILLYGAKYVPVGEDQRQHVEFTRNLAERINNRFHEIFILPANNEEQIKFMGLERPIRIRSLRHPTKKMSKSSDDPSGTISLSDTPEIATRKIMEATTDSKGRITYGFNGQPGISNLIQIIALLQGVGLEEMASRYQGQTSYSRLKEDAAREVSDFLTDLQAKVSDTDDKKIMAKLESAEQSMSKAANSTLLKVQQAVGLRPKT